MGNTVASKSEANNLKQFLLAPRKLALAVALALAAGSPLTHAAGLGRLTVQSALGQPLKAEVEITSLSKEEANSLSVRLAPVDAFKQAGLEYNAALGNVRFAIDRRPDGRALVRITSTQPLNEPFVDLLLELNWATGKFVREYTFLLDPPELKLARESTSDSAQSSTQSAAVAPVVTPLPPAQPAQPAPAPQATQAPQPAQAPQPTQAPQSTPRPQPVAETPRATRPAPEPVTRATPSPAPSPSESAKRVTKPVPPLPREKTPKAAPVAATPKPDTGGSSAPVQVKNGDTLAGIAARVKPSDVTLDQAVVAIYRSNPSAFFGSVHQLRAGSTLNVPDRSAIAAIDATEARTEVRAKSANFQGYKSRLAASAQAVPAAKAGQSASGKVGAKVEDGAQVAGKGDQLKLSRGSGDAEASSAGKSLASRDARAERKVATDVAVKESQSRVVELEKNVSDLQKLVEMKNKQLADLQKQVDAAKSGATVAGTIARPDPKAAAKAAADKAAADKLEAAQKQVADKAATAKLAAEKAVADKLAAEKAAAEKSAAQNPTAEKPAATAEMAKAEPPKTEPAKSEAPGAEAPKATEPLKSGAAPTEAPKKITPKPAPVAESGGFFDDLLGNPLVLPGLGAILALGAGYGWYAMRRRKREEKFEDSLIAADGFTQNSLFGTTGGQNVDTNNSMFSSQRNTAADVHSTEVDPIAEAEVYIAYGREAQAEEILREALKKQPDRQAIRLKLLEIYAGRKDTKAFGTLATDMYTATSGQNEEWPKVVTLGLAIDPENPLYTGKSPLKTSGGSADTASNNLGTLSAAPSTPSTPSAGSGFSAAPVVAAAGAIGAGALASVASSASQAASAAKSAAASVAVPVIPSSSVDKRAAPEEVPSLDFALDLDAEIDKGKAARAAASDLSKAVEGKFDLPSLDMGNQGAKGAAASKNSLHDEFGGLNIDLPSLERIDSSASSAEAQGIDLSAIGLDLQPSTMTPPPTADAARWQEMATKLDLASAYEEIGDKEGARELLQEVVKGGDTDQQQKARTMLSKIS